MTRREIIERVQSLYSKGAASDDSRLSARHIYSKIKTARTFFLRREANKYKRLSERNVEYLECIRMKEAEPYDCPCLPPAGYTFLKSMCPLPKTISSSLGDHLHSVTSIDGGYIFSKTSWEAKKYKSGNKYTSGTKDYFIKNDYLYITSSEKLRAVTVAGIFEDIDSFNCSYCCDEDEVDCGSILDQEFKVDAHLIEPIMELAVKELVQLFTQIPEDKENDSTDR